VLVVVGCSAVRRALVENSLGLILAGLLAQQAAFLAAAWLRVAGLAAEVEVAFRTRPDSPAPAPTPEPVGDTHPIEPMPTTRTERPVDVQTPSAPQAPAEPRPPAEAQAPVEPRPPAGQGPSDV
jgi:hypothetical protein